MIKANNPELKTWITVPKNSDFPIQNIPFGVFKTKDNETHACTRIGDTVIDLYVLAKKGILDLDGENASIFQGNLNDFITNGKAYTREIRNQISDLFLDSNNTTKNDTDLMIECFHSATEVKMLLPVKIGDYTDFYSSREHAFNVGTMFRGADKALQPNWVHLPVGYHGRASSILPSGVAVHRPKGQLKPADKPPVFGECQRLDFELETAFITHQGKPLGQNITTAEAEDFIFGMVIFNDWSARDIQKWEYVPLGPFLAKSFASSISPWIITLDALEPFKVDSPKQDPEVLDYLKIEGQKSYDINLNVFLKTEKSEEVNICNSNHKYLYWTMAQQLAHHTINGCNVNAGDMMASGTISGKGENEFGSMLELSWNGTKSIKMPDGSERKFIEDNDTVIMRAWSEKNGVRVGFGEVAAQILPALK